MMAEETKDIQTPEEEPAGETAPENEAAPAEPEKAKKEKKAKKPSELEKLQGDYNELNDRYLRLAAEYDNYRKRSARERDGLWQDATAKAVGNFLTVADNFERALQTPCGDAEFLKGMELIYRSLHETLVNLGAEPFGEEGEAFDPALHNAVMHVDDDAYGAQVIAQVLQKGYRIGDRILRHAMVKVAN